MNGHALCFLDKRTHPGLGEETSAERLAGRNANTFNVVAVPRLKGLQHRYDLEA